jgi:hypothetical protein
MTLAEFIEEKGYEHGVYGSTKHGVGLPTGIKVKPNYSPIDGSHTLVVTGEQVISCVCAYPWGANDWRIRQSKAYDNPEGCAKAIEELANPPKGCWD